MWVCGLCGGMNGLDSDMIMFLLLSLLLLQCAGLTSKKKKLNPRKRQTHLRQQQHGRFRISLRTNHRVAFILLGNTKASSAFLRFHLPIYLLRSFYPTLLPRSSLFAIFNQEKAATTKAPFTKRHLHIVHKIQERHEC